MDQHIALSGFWPGFRVTRFQTQARRVCVRLEPDLNVAPVCSRCLRECTGVHDSQWRRVRDLPMLGHQVDLEVLIQRVACPVCGPRLQQLSWLARYSRVTQRLAEAVAIWCARLPVAHVAEFFGLHWSTVREIDRRHLRQRLSELPPAQPRRLIMDEFALHKGHRYASVVLDADTKRVLWIGLGRSRAAAREPSRRRSRPVAPPRAGRWRSRRCAARARHAGLPRRSGRSGSPETAPYARRRTPCPVRGRSSGRC